MPSSTTSIQADQVDGSRARGGMPGASHRVPVLVDLASVDETSDTRATGDRGGIHAPAVPARPCCPNDGRSRGLLGEEDPPNGCPHQLPGTRDLPPAPRYDRKAPIRRRGTGMACLPSGELHERRGRLQGRIRGTRRVRRLRPHPQPRAPRRIGEPNGPIARAPSAVMTV